MRSAGWSCLGFPASASAAIIHALSLSAWRHLKWWQHSWDDILRTHIRLKTNTNLQKLSGIILSVLSVKKRSYCFFPLHPFSVRQFSIEICLSTVLLRLKSWVIINMGDSPEIKLGNAELKISGCGETAFCEMPLDCMLILAHSESLPVLKHNSLHDLTWPARFITDQENGKCITYSLLTPYSINFRAMF